MCPVCGTQMVLIGEEYVRRELEFIPATCKVIEYYRQSYGCPSCKDGLDDTENL
ncbi:MULTISPECIES: IS66 family transposase zinc-finger binding domain-containing protein [Mediterraneibacter]